ncbi:3-oxoacyl-ACP synthase III family protein [Flavobacterium sp.]|jgi:3-oxoacyl-[acyl-carrier-protein] synthase-3|uniref:3-oxoacyl-ACP synthase III family protein n=1 Tax=Flavobacterium sp. TaxID=239 RepID=UPI0037C13E48
MALFEVENIHIEGISACVPKNLVKTSDLELFSEKEAQVFSQNTGIKQRYISDGSICASDLCFQAATNIIEKLNWVKEEIDVLIFISQSPDYILPATSNLLQNRLGLSKDCFCLDVSLGCSGYIYGLSLISNLLQNSKFNKALLLVGDTISTYSSPNDKSVYPLFGDAGTATAIQFDSEKNSKWTFDIGTDGSGLEAIKIQDGGARNRTSVKSLEYNYINDEDKDIGKRRAIDLQLNGIDVFNFAIKVAPGSIKKIFEKTNSSSETIDYLFLHQANLFMNETIRKRLKVDKEKAPNSIENFGNTNGASIPLTIVQTFKDIVIEKDLSVVMCGFGVGLSWGSVFMNMQKSLVTDMSFYNAE